MPAKAKIFRRPNPGKGQGSMQAIHPVSGNEYEHDETDAQILAIEELMDSVRLESGASNENQGVGPAGCCLRGATFSWTSSTDDGEGDIAIATSYTAEGDGTVSHRGRQLDGKVWVQESWTIAPDGIVT